MASNKNALAMCDTCGFVYPHRVMKLNSYGMLVCPQDFDGQDDLKNSPLNKVPDVRDDLTISNPSPDTGGSQINWEAATNNWDAEDRWWQTI